jgi:hypothetical protein
MTMCRVSRGELRRARWVAALLSGILLTSLAGAQDWVIEVVDQGEAGSYVGGWSSLALDAAGYPHISYMAWPDGDLKYAYKDSSGWHIMILTGYNHDPYDFGHYSSLALDAAGYAHISHWESYYSSLQYNWQDSSGWHSYGVDGGGLFCSLALDSRGFPHISYQGANWCYAEYAWKDMSGWHTEVVESTYSGGMSLALDGAGLPHLCYGPPSKYAFRDSLGWHIEELEGVGSWLSLEVDALARPHMCSIADGELWYTYRDGGAWQRELVDPGPVGGSVANTSLSLDASGQPSISYYCYGVLRCASRNGVGWHIETVDDESDAGSYNSLALDGSGRPHISYRYDDATSGSLRYAYRRQQTASDVGGGVPSPPLILSQVGPNPVRGNLLVTYHLNSWADVAVTLRNLRGETVWVLDQGPRPAGSHTVSWFPDHGPNGLQGQGLVVLVLESGGRRVARRLIVAR